MRTDDDPAGMSWLRFGVMIAVSTGLMFLLMYQLVYSPEHVLFSITRLISALVMACVMAAVMLGFMWRMYRPDAAKITVLAGAVLGGSALLAINRSQAVVDDISFMQAMIPHHSIAINNAVKADLRDPRVRYLADRITRDQVKEIVEMRLLIEDIRRDGRRGDTTLRPAAPSLGQEAADEAAALRSGRLLAEEPL